VAARAVLVDADHPVLDAMGLVAVSLPIPLDQMLLKGSMPARALSWGDRGELSRSGGHEVRIFGYLVLLGRIVPPLSSSAGRFLHNIDHGMDGRGKKSTST
jgi:hypothetical protein